METIIYSIISRGELKIQYKGKFIRITGELIFKPPMFYADINSLKKIEGITEDEKKQIMQFIINDSFQKIGTKIIFD